MTTILQLGDACGGLCLRTLTGAEVLPLLAEYQILPLLVKEMIIDQAIAHVECTSEEAKQASERLAEQYQFTSEAVRQLWLQQHGMSVKQFDAMAIRQFKLEKFKQTTWSGDLESYFFQRKPHLDRVVYSLISTPDIGIAQELYFRIQEKEQSFAQLAREYAQGPEGETDGLVGPVELQTIHPILAKMLSTSQPQELLPPTQLGEWIVIVRLEKLLPVKFDRSLRQRLLNERFHSWLQTQLTEQNWQIQHPESAYILSQIG
ncbi:peptidylprolyl isomerase [Calothrix sp. PCC 7507]|uniref:peptidylprolyl isomerase n=1 Tax=Calothrix sp. PCC 7507 TaxID=99598 RepID=UPI0005A982E0|nr:peptidylprolyl isomerase [Calothrix sp. PCC 7507]